MSIGSKPPRLADQLRSRCNNLAGSGKRRDAPRAGGVTTALGAGRDWQDLEGFARSAQRAAWRLLVQGRYDPFEELQSLDQLEGWLVLVASRKFSDALRAGRETAHAQTVYLHLHDRAGLNNLGDETAAAVLGELEQCLEDETDRAVFRGKLEEKSETELSLQLRCSTRKVRGVWQRIRQRMVRCSSITSEPGIAR